MTTIDNPVPQSQDSDFDWQKAKAEQRDKHLQRATEVCGADKVEGIVSSAEQLETAFLDLAARSSEFGKTPDEMCQLIRDFSNAFYGRLNSDNLNPKNTVKALNTATSIMRPEDFDDDIRNDAHEMAQKILG